jgi:hypothetical protein
MNDLLLSVLETRWRDSVMHNQETLEAPPLEEETKLPLASIDLASGKAQF